MLEYYRLYLPKSKREVKIEVSVPRNRDNVTFDTIYFLDGQNAFKDSHASFGRSLRAAAHQIEIIISLHGKTLVLQPELITLRKIQINVLTRFICQS